jgi:diguanylate cyclase (GGDEF)-like protein/PAS domain S-box-containing protein
MILDPNTVKKRSEMLDTVLNHLPQGIVVVGPDYRIITFNQTLEIINVLPEGTYRIGKDFRDVIRVWATETGQSEEMLDRALAELDLVHPFNFQYSQQVRGETRWVELSHDPLPGGGFVRTFTDITNQKRLEEKLILMARTDSLTGLLNHHTFHETAADEVKRIRRHSRPLTLMSIDLDHFKQINDHFGHPAGDEVLRAFAAALSICMREADAIGRVGGEEFSVLMSDTKLESARQAAERLLELVRTMQVKSPGYHQRIPFTISIGLAEYIPPMTAEQLINAADQALYQAKSEGRDCYRIAQTQPPHPLRPSITQPD